MPKVKVCQFTREGFVSGYGLIFENGTILKTHSNDFLWGGKDNREKAKANFWSVVDLLKDQGFEIEIIGE